MSCGTARPTGSEILALYRSGALTPDDFRHQIEVCHGPRLMWLALRMNISSTVARDLMRIVVADAVNVFTEGDPLTTVESHLNSRMRQVASDTLRRCGVHRHCLQPYFDAAWLDVIVDEYAIIVEVSQRRSDQAVPHLAPAYDEQLMRNDQGIPHAHGVIASLKLSNAWRARHRFQRQVTYEPRRGSATQTSSCPHSRGWSDRTSRNRADRVANGRFQRITRDSARRRCDGVLRSSRARGSCFGALPANTRGGVETA